MRNPFSMKARFCYALFVVLFSTLVLSACRQPDNQTSDDKPIYFSDYSGKWILINYWADWCKPCRHEMPALNNIYHQYRDNVAIFGVSFDPLPKQSIQQTVDQYHLDYPMLMHNPADYFALDRHVKHLPATYVISPEGKVVDILYGAQTEENLSGVLLAHLQPDDKEMIG